MRLDISKDGGSKSNLFVKLHMLPILVHMSQPRISCDQSSNLNNMVDVGATQPAFVMLESAPFSCEELSISCEFGHVRYLISFRNLSRDTGVQWVNSYSHCFLNNGPSKSFCHFRHSITLPLITFSIKDILSYLSCHLTFCHPDFRKMQLSL